MTIKAGFDLAELDPIATPLHHTITPANVDIVAIGRLDHDITGPVPTGAVQIPEGAPTLLRQVLITSHHRRTGDAQLPPLARFYLAAFLVQNSGLQMLAGLAD